jgi:hypothetical protein
MAGFERDRVGCDHQEFAGADPGVGRELEADAPGESPAGKIDRLGSGVGEFDPFLPILMRRGMEEHLVDLDACGVGEAVDQPENAEQSPVAKSGGSLGGGTGRIRRGG